MDSARYLRSHIFRALDYLPPGEISLLDYGRALCAVNYLSYPEDSLYQDWIIQEFTRRKIAHDPARAGIPRATPTAPSPAIIPARAR